VGGWTTRELLTILDGLEGIELIGADVGKFRQILPPISAGYSDMTAVEVAPIYDNPGEVGIIHRAWTEETLTVELDYGTCSFGSRTLAAHVDGTAAR